MGKKMLCFNFVFTGDLGIGQEQVFIKVGLRAQDCLFMDKHCFIISGDLGIGRERVITKAGLSAQDCLFMGKHCFTFYCDFREFVY